MSISATSNYMSNADIMEWMQLRTDELYGQMRGAMEGASERADAESALDNIKATITNSKDGNADATRDLINATLEKYKDVPEVAQTLQPILDELNKRYEQAAIDANKPQLVFGAHGGPVTIAASHDPQPVTISSADVDTWTKEIGDQVDALGKQDSLDMINIQEMNNQINQAKQTASGLIDSSAKTINDIISHIS